MFIVILMVLSEERVLIVGLGNIGASLAKVAIRAGKTKIEVWNRSLEKAETLFTAEEKEEEDLEFSVARSLLEALQSASIIVISLSDYKTSYKALQQDENDLSTLSPFVKALEGKTVLQMTSSIPSESKQWSCLMGAAKAQNVDGCVIGWPSMVGSDSFSLLISGCEEVLYKKVRPVLRIWGKPTFVGPQPGQADALDIAVLTFLQGIKFGFMQGLALCEEAGVSIDQYTSFCKHYLSVYQSVLDDTAEKVKIRDYTTHINTTVNILYKFNRNVLKHAAETGQSQELLRAIDAPLHALVATGKGSVDQTASFEYMLDQTSKFFKQ